MAFRKNLTLALGIIIAALILAQTTVRENHINRTKTAISGSKIEQISSL